ncbi:MAG: terminase small subunit [Phycisphaerales bacterium]
MLSLNGKRKLFVHYYLNESKGNATDAARRAGYSNAEIGRQLLRNLTVRAAIDAGLDEAGLTSNEILARLSEIALSDIGDFIKTSIDDNGNETFNIDILKAKRHKRTAVLKKVKVGRNGVEIELLDPLAALEKLGKFRGMWEKSEAKPTASSQSIDDFLNDADLDAR